MLLKRATKQGSKFRTTDTQGEGEKKKKKRRRSPEIRKEVAKLIPLKEYDADNEYFICKDGSIINLFKFICKDLTTTNAQDIEMDILALTKHYRLFSDDAKIISTNIPVDCKTQIDYFTWKIEHCKNEYQKRLLIKKREEQIWLEKNRLNKEFFYMIFASSAERYEENYKTLLSTLHQQRLIGFLDYEGKIQVLYKLMNKNLRR